MTSIANYSIIFCEVLILKIYFYVLIVYQFLIYNFFGSKYTVKDGEKNGSWTRFCWLTEQFEAVNKSYDEAAQSKVAQWGFQTERKSAYHEKWQISACF